MATIRKLSQTMINRIAAGEVIERPASVVKELMENAIDAGAARIDLSVSSGGSDLIRLVDDGCGIDEDQLPLAMTANATSKVVEPDDLFKIGTLGFRGEALASIGEVSRLLIRSRKADCDSGAQLEVVGGNFSEVTPCGAPRGTTIEVANLFYNMPVRRKGLRTTVTEFGHIKESFTRIALAMPQLDFSLSHNDRKVLDLTGANTLLDRVSKLFGYELAENLIQIKSQVGDIQITGYVGHPSQHRANARMQYLLLNGRHIRDRSLQHALREAYRGLLISGRYPICFLNIAIPPEMVDVNVHPTKIEVRFHDPQPLYSQLLSTLRTKFLATDMHSRIRVSDDSVDSPSSESGETNPEPNRLQTELIDWARQKSTEWTGSSETSTDLTPPHKDPYEPAARQNDSNAQYCSSRSSSNERYSASTSPVSINHQPGDCSGEIVENDSHKAVQIHDRYLVAESSDGLMIVDQHALHERILYEQLKKRIAEGRLDVQKMLVPEPVDLSGPEAAAVIENRELLAELGLLVEPFGGDTILVSGYPAMLSRSAPSELLQELLNVLLDEDREPGKETLIDEILHSMACKAAIKAGDRLEQDEIDSLLASRHLVQDAHHCPHGRPSALIFSQKELDKQFKRL
jgi:DNA mismatch repair protein MutL